MGGDPHPPGLADRAAGHGLLPLRQRRAGRAAAGGRGGGDGRAGEHRPAARGRRGHRRRRRLRGRRLGGDARCARPVRTGRPRRRRHQHRGFTRHDAGRAGRRPGGRAGDGRGGLPVLRPHAGPPPGLGVAPDRCRRRAGAAAAGGGRGGGPARDGGLLAARRHGPPGRPARQPLGRPGPPIVLGAAGSPDAAGGAPAARRRLRDGRLEPRRRVPDEDHRLPAAAVHRVGLGAGTAALGPRARQHPRGGGPGGVRGGRHRPLPRRRGRRRAAARRGGRARAGRGPPVERA